MQVSYCGPGQQSLRSPGPIVGQCFTVWEGGVSNCFSHFDQDESLPMESYISIILLTEMELMNRKLSE